MLRNGWCRGYCVDGWLKKSINLFCPLIVVFFSDPPLDTARSRQTRTLHAWLGLRFPSPSLVVPTCGPVSEFLLSCGFRGGSVGRRARSNTSKILTQRLTFVPYLEGTTFSRILYGSGPFTLSASPTWTKDHIRHD